MISGILTLLSWLLCLVLCLIAWKKGLPQPYLPKTAEPPYFQQEGSAQYSDSQRNAEQRIEKFWDFSEKLLHSLSTQQIFTGFALCISTVQIYNVGPESTWDNPHAELATTLCYLAQTLGFVGLLQVRRTLNELKLGYLVRQLASCVSLSVAFRLKTSVVDKPLLVITFVLSGPLLSLWL